MLNLRDSKSALEAVAKADYIFFGGGDQVDLLKWMDAAPQSWRPSAISTRRARWWVA